MSRYQWPARGRKSKDRPFERLRWNISTDGVLLEEAVRHVDSAIRPRVAPSGPVDLWVPIGPSTVLLGQASSRPRVAGRVRDIAVGPDGLRAYAATANGGVWFTGDAGLTWAPLGNWLATPAAAGINRPVHALVCGCLLVIFGGAADGSADTVYVGTGELTPTRTSGTPGSRLGGVGVLKLNKPVPAAIANPFQQHWDRELSELTGFGIYRLANQPGSSDVLVAATSIGVFARSAAGAWSRASGANLPNTRVTTDAAWADLGGGNHRLWVAVLDGADTAVWTSTGGAAGAFTKVALPNVVLNGRLGIAVAPSDKTIVYVLGSGPRLWRINGTTPTQVQKLPNNLFVSASDQSDYDLAIAVHPDNKDIVAAGGATIEADGVWSASLYRFNIAAAGGGLSAGFLDANQGAGAAADPTFIGHGVHADVHQIRYIKAGAEVHVWVGCDGGVFRSANAGDRNTFLARNAGLAVLETGFVASHPENETFVLAGTQDNGTLMRVGDTVWMWSESNGGDGGGTLIHPVKTSYFVGQYANSSWYSNGNITQAVLRGTGGTSEANEDGRASFYSSGDIRRVGATAQARLAIGTHRVWLADNWDPEATPTAWVTLPSATDPRAGGGTDIAQDVFGEGTGQVIACRWAADDRLLALIQSRRPTGDDSAILLFTRQADGKWPSKAISKHANKKSDYSNGDIPTPTSGHLPPLGAWSDIAIHDPARGTNGSCYVACTGHVKLEGGAPVESANMDTLWWYNGTDTWHPTGLRNNGTKAPAYAVVVDSGDPNTVYVGTALGVWRGVLSFAGENPSWVWTAFSNGLPEAPVQDLSLYRSGTTKILRAAIQARGVWEVDLSAPVGPIQRTYLRVHANDSRRSASSPLANPMKIGPVEWPFHASPDIRIRPAMLTGGETAPTPPAIIPFPWAGAAPDTYWLWVFQTGLHKLDPLVRVNGRWNNHFRARLIAHDAAEGNQITATRWTNVVTAANVFTTPWDDRGAGAGAPPEPEATEADLFELVVENPAATDGPAAGPPDVSLVAARRHKIDVLVHYRDLRPLAASEVRVALFRRDLPATPADWATIAIDAPLRTRIEQLLLGSPPGDWALPAPWIVADAAFRTKPLTAAIDARTPRVVTFETDFTGVAANQHILLLAVVHSTPDPVSAASLSGANLKALVQTCHHVAARVVQIRA